MCIVKSGESVHHKEDEMGNYAHYKQWEMGKAQFWNPAQYHTFVEIDHEIISTVILLPSADLIKKGCCQLQAKVCAQITG